ncbi:MAG TPA: ATP-binding protein [Candidatus Limnocylindria bacterium]
MRARYASAVQYVAALAGVAAISVVIGLVLGIAAIPNISTLYLIVVLAAATKLGRGPAIVASLAAFVAYDWFFTQPLHTFTIADPSEWIALSVFLLTAVITSELAANERKRAELAERREREAVFLFDALRLMGDPDLDAALGAVAERLRSELPVRSVAISLAVAARTHRAVAGPEDENADTTEVLAAGRRPTARVPGGPARWIRVIPPARGASAFAMRGALRRSEIPIRSGAKTVGRLSFIRDDTSSWNASDSRVLALIAASIASVVERAELRDATTRTEVLRRTDELRTALLAAVSHDLRTPLASIIASAGSLRQPDVEWTDAERREFLADIEHEARRLSRIVDNLLDLSRIEAGALRPDRGWYDVSALIDDVVGRLRSVTFAHPTDVSVPEELPPILLDYVEIDQVLTNLIENAVKHTPAGTPIHVAARVDGSMLVVEVSDDGPGVDPRTLAHVFDAFVRGPQGARSTDGSGLGLAVARGLVEAHGGDIAVENRAGRGVTFRFRLPLGAQHLAPASAT